MKNYDKKLFKTLERGKKTATDKQFLKNLSKWIFDLSGNVNVTMRLKNLAEKV